MGVEAFDGIQSKCLSKRKRGIRPACGGKTLWLRIKKEVQMAREGALVWVWKF